MYAELPHLARACRSGLSTPTRAVSRTTRLLACTALALLASACSKDRPEASVLPTPPAVAESAGPAARPADTSVPAAESVVMPTGTTPRADATAGRANAAMTRSEESSAMPTPGQNNDHSAPLAPAKRASGP